MSQEEELEKRKASHRDAIYKWRQSHPDKYRELSQKSSLTYYYKHREEVAERRKKERIERKTAVSIT
jgi:ABC-type nitrate/sulfonate/bicarbonate transport system substrate-binding protein